MTTPGVWEMFTTSASAPCNAIPFSVTRIQSHKGFTAHDLCWVARKSIPKLEHRIGSDRVEVVITVDKACQALPNDVKERIESGKRSIGRVTHLSTPVFGTPSLTARAVSSCQHPPRCNSGRGMEEKPH